MGCLLVGWKIEEEWIFQVERMRKVLDEDEILQFDLEIIEQYGVYYGSFVGNVWGVG